MLVQQVIAAAEELYVAIDRTTELLNAKYNKRVKFNLELIIERAVDKFYESYSPTMYGRQEGLYTAKKITVNDEEWSFDTGPTYMTTSYGGEDGGVGTDYIYINSFEQGFHGGAIGGPDHPEPGVPWWKAHGEWYKPATQGPAPDSLINPEAQNYIDEQEQAYEDEWVKIIQPYYKKFMDLYNTLESAIGK